MGEMLVCGMGVSVVCVVGVLLGCSEWNVCIELLGGEFELNWDEMIGYVLKMGFVVEIFCGEWGEVGLDEVIFEVKVS